MFHLHSSSATWWGPSGEVACEAQGLCFVVFVCVCVCESDTPLGAHSAYPLFHSRHLIFFLPYILKISLDRIWKENVWSQIAAVQIHMHSLFSFPAAAYWTWQALECHGLKMTKSLSLKIWCTPSRNERQDPTLKENVITRRCPDVSLSPCVNFLFIVSLFFCLVSLLQPNHVAVWSKAWTVPSSLQVSPTATPTTPTVRGW